MIDYESLRRFATDSQIVKLDALKKYGTQIKAARALDINDRSFTRGLESLVKQAAKRGYDPDNNLLYPVGKGQELKGQSVLYDADGNIKQQWIKSQSDKQAEQADRLNEAIQAIKDEIKPLKPTKRPKVTSNDLVNTYIITDYHLGMLAWDEETGDNWDTDIAESLLYNWFSEAIKRSPDSEVGVLAQLGDFLHWDGLDAVTPQHKHLLDADTRFQKIVRVAIRVFRRIIDDLLKKHNKVHVIMAEGNHDPASSIWLRELFHALYDKEPRVYIELSPDPYYCYEHGDTSLFFHHGHKRKPANLDDVFVAKFREIFGRTKYSYGHTGHLHHKEVKESNLMVIEQHRTLSSNDAYASRGGWITGRDASCITYHKAFGEVSRITINPKMAA